MDASSQGSSEEEEQKSLQKLHPTLPKTFEEKSNHSRVIVILEAANLETIKTKRGIELLNCDDHGKIIGKMGKKLEDYRPDVTHQSLMALYDSPLNQAGLLQVFITTNKKACIQLSPMLQIPRTFRAFSALMAQCLTKLKVRAESGSQTLMSIVKNPVTDHLPIGCKIIGTSCKAELKTMKEYV